MAGDDLSHHSRHSCRHTEKLHTPLRPNPSGAVSWSRRSSDATRHICQHTPVLAQPQQLPSWAARPAPTPHTRESTQRMGDEQQSTTQQFCQMTVTRYHILHPPPAQSPPTNRMSLTLTAVGVCVHPRAAHSTDTTAPTPAPTRPARATHQLHLVDSVRGRPSWRRCGGPASRSHGI